MAGWVDGEDGRGGRGAAGVGGRRRARAAGGGRRRPMAAIGGAGCLWTGLPSIFLLFKNADEVPSVRCKGGSRCTEGSWGTPY